MRIDCIIFRCVMNQKDLIIVATSEEQQQKISGHHNKIIGSFWETTKRACASHWPAGRDHCEIPNAKLVSLKTVQQVQL